MTTAAFGGRRRFRSRCATLSALDAEWAALVVDPEAGATCRRWAAAESRLAGCADVADVLGRVAGTPDAVLGLLLGRCADGDVLAGRVVLQALLPKMVAMAARDRVAGVEDYLTALWCVIAGYPLARRPTSVAANLALDTLKAVHRERRPAGDVTAPPEWVLISADRHPVQLLGARPATGPGAREVLDRARQRRLIDPATDALLRSVYADGLSGAAAAARHGLTPVAVRLRCSRALKVLARNAALLADA